MFDGRQSPFTRRPWHSGGPVCHVGFGEAIPGYETDRIALEKAKEESESTDEEGRKKRFARPQKEPGKLPPREEDQASSSRDAAADMLKKFFNNR